MGKKYISSRFGAIALALIPALLLAQQHHVPQQPIPFSHKQHAGTLQLKCQNCHTNPSPGAVEGFPPASTCMACHASIGTDKPAIQQLKSLASGGPPIHWARVYQIPSYVRFSHRVHIRGGFTCERCHGPVATRDTLWKESDISMDGCVSCHKQHKASIACTTCHENRG